MPPTLVSNDQAALRAFAAEGRTICKPISQGLVGSAGAWFAIHTREVSAGDFDEAQPATSVPTLVQRLVPRGMDVRLTIIGDAAFPVEVRTPADAPVDWRATGRGLAYTVCTAPPEILRACRALMRTLGLVYGAFDFIRADDGAWHFLEVNPAGEWAWLEVELDLPMRDAFVALFYGG